jgi:hypothetical protein
MMELLKELLIGFAAWLLSRAIGVGALVMVLIMFTIRTILKI